MRTLTIAAIALLALTGCAIESSDSDSGGGGGSSGAFEWCGISGPGIAASTDISTLDPSNQSEYCDSFRWGYRNISTSSGDCEGFWDETDEDIVAFFMTVEGGDLTRSQAIGLIDAMWVKC